MNGRAFNCAERTVDATVAGMWFQQFAAAFAVVIELASIRGHAFTRLVATVGTGNYRIFIELGHACLFLAGAAAIEAVW